jgi:hypothetical protein
VLACHDRRDEWGCDIGKALVRSDDGRGRVVLIVAGSLDFLGRVRIVVLVRVGRQRAQPDGNAGGLEVGRIECDDANDIVVVWLQILNGNGRLLGRYVANWNLSVLLACLPCLPTINAVDPDNIFED